MTDAAPAAVPGDEPLLRQLLAEGGLSIETLDPAGDIQFRTVVQLDGDVIHWIRRTPAPAGGATAGIPDVSRADEHLATVAAHVAALEGALTRLEGQALRWIRKVRAGAQALTVASGATAVFGKLSLQPLLLIAGGASGAVSIAAWWIGGRLGRRLLRRIARWIGAKIS